MLGPAQVRPHLLHVVAGLRTGLDEHDAQFFGALLPFLDGYLPGEEGTRAKSVPRRSSPWQRQKKKLG